MSLSLPILSLKTTFSLTLDRSEKSISLNDLSFKEVTKARPFHSLNSEPL